VQGLRGRNLEALHRVNVVGLPAADAASVIDDPFARYADGLLTGMFSCMPEPVPWFAENRLMAGRGHSLVSLGGTGKTRALYGLGVGGVIGRLPWDWKVTRTGSAALFLTEDTAHDVHRVMHTLGSQLTEQERVQVIQRLRVFPLAGNPLRLLELVGNRLVEGAAFDWLQERIDMLPKPVVFIGIDPALAVTDGDELNPSHQRRLGELVDRLAIATGACVVLTTHAAKAINQADELGSHAARGSGALTDAVRGEYVLRNMTADEARRFGIEDRAERQRYVQLAATKGNSMPPEAFAPTWLRRGEAGLLSGVTLDQVERGSVGQRELQALEIMKQHAHQGDLTLSFWRGQCEQAGLVSGTSDGAKEKSMQRIKDALFDAGLIAQGARRGLWVPK
jgi:hypothetical protein